MVLIILSVFISSKVYVHRIWLEFLLVGFFSHASYFILKKSTLIEHRNKAFVAINLKLLRFNFKGVIHLIGNTQGFLIFSVSTSILPSLKCCSQKCSIKKTFTLCKNKFK